MKCYSRLCITLLLLLSCISCSKEDSPDLQDTVVVEEDVSENTNEGKGDNEKDDGAEEGKSLLNFIGDSIIDYWKSLDDYFPDFECHNYGWSAKGIDTFLGRIDVKLLADTECVVEIGTNDMRRVINADTIDNYIEHYIDVLVSLKTKRIYLLSLLPRNRAKDGGFDFNSRYPEINGKIKKRVAERMDNVIYIPLFDLFFKNGQINWDYTYDGLHPNAKGYEVMASEMGKYLIKE